MRGFSSWTAAAALLTWSAAGLADPLDETDTEAAGAAESATVYVAADTAAPRAAWPGAVTHAPAPGVCTVDDPPGGAATLARPASQPEDLRPRRDGDSHAATRDARDWAMLVLAAMTAIVIGGRRLREPKT